jgi:hypothetical protein
MSAQEEKFVKYWSEKRKLGKWRFALKHGILFFAIPAFSISEIFKYLWNSDHQFDIKRLIVGLPIWMVLGFFAMGTFQWNAQEKRYKELTHATGTDSMSQQE